MRQEQGEKENKRENASSNLQKIAKFFYNMFCGDPELDPVINRSIVFNTYMQIAELIYILSLYTWFDKTNNSTYDAVQGTFSGFSIVACMVPRLIVNKHYSLLITLIVFVCLTLGGIASTILLIKNYFTFQNYCNILSNYAVRNPSFDFQAASICGQIANFYWMILAANGIISILRIAYIVCVIKAYEVAKKMFNQEEQKRRRKEKFDLNRKRRYDLHKSLSPAMLIFDHFLTQVQQLLSREVGCDFYFLGLIGPHSLLQAHVHLDLLDALCLSLFFYSFFIFFCEILSLNDLCLFLDQILHVGRILLQKWFLKQDRLVTEDQGNCSLLGGFKNGVLDYDRISFLDLASEKSLIAVDGPTTGGDGSTARFGLVIYDLILNDDIFFQFLLLFFGLSGFLGDVGRFGDSFFEFQFPELQTHSVFIREQQLYTLKTYE